MPHCQMGQMTCCVRSSRFFFFNDTATTEIYTLSLHDALPISSRPALTRPCGPGPWPWGPAPDRKSTRLNSSHSQSSYAVFCLKKKKQTVVTDAHEKPAEIVGEQPDPDSEI